MTNTVDIFWNSGYLLELMGTKLLSLDQPIQIIGMSATLPVRPRVHKRSTS